MTESTVELRCCKTEKWPNSLVVPERFPELCDMEEEAETGFLGQSTGPQQGRHTDEQAGRVNVEKAPFSCDIPLE